MVTREFFVKLELGDLLLTDIRVYSHEFEFDSATTEDWVKEAFRSTNIQEIYEMFGIKPENEGDWQVIAKGEISGWREDYVGDWIDEFTISEFEVRKIDD